MTAGQSDRLTDICLRTIPRPVLIFYLSTEQIEDGAGTAQDDLALKREEEKQNSIKRRKYLPNDGGDLVIILPLLLCVLSLLS